MNVTAHQEKEKNKQTKTGMKKAGEGKRQVTDFREAVCCPSAVVQGAARRKIGLRGVPWVTGTLGKKQKPFRPNLNGAGDRTTTLRWLLIGADSILFAITVKQESCEYLF